MKISVIGAGYVGLVSSAIFADWGHDVICLDNDTRKIARILAGDLPVYEPGLPEMVERNRLEERLCFTADLQKAVTGRDLLLIAVGTPQGQNGQPNLSALWNVVTSLKRHVDAPVTLVIKSTVPVGTCEAVWKYLNEKASVNDTAEQDLFDLVFVPEFLRQGTAIADFLSPDRTVVGCRTDHAKAIVEDLLGRLDGPMLFTDWQSAEMIKYAANAFLAMKISYINTIANLCEEVGADIHQVGLGIGMDQRIGSAFLKPGVGFGGSCLPKDTQALIALGETHGVNVSLFQEVLNVNEEQRKRIVAKLMEALGGIRGKRIAILGLAFKANTNDVRETPALPIIDRIVKLGGEVTVYDPVVEMEELSKQYSFEPAGDLYSAVRSTDAVVILTDWEEFYGMDLQRVRKMVRTPLIVDGRNLFAPKIVKQHGFDYIPVGKPHKIPAQPVSLD